MKKETGKKKEQVEKRSVFPFDFFHLLFHFSHMGWKKNSYFIEKGKKKKIIIFPSKSNQIKKHSNKNKPKQLIIIII